MKYLFKFACTLILMATVVGGYVAIQLIIIAVCGTLLPAWLFAIVLVWLVSVNYRILMKGEVEKL